MDSTADIKIRPATDNDEDAAAILKCLAAAFEAYNPPGTRYEVLRKNGYHRSGKIGDFFGMPLIEYEKYL